jgi:hypothetical protein
LASRGSAHAQVRTGGDHRLATNAAAKLFATGRLRQAETAYRELVAKHGDAESYTGLARTLVSLEDSDSALAVLRDGAAAFAKKNDRVSAVALLGVAVEIVPLDLAAHRRLAAALANQGDLIGACEEYERYIDAALKEKDTRRAWLELAYGRETLGDLPQLLKLADKVAAAQGGAKPTPPPPVRAAATPSTIPAARPTIIGAAEVGTKQAPLPPLPSLSATMQARTRPDASSAVVLKDARTMTHAERSDVTSSSALLARAGLKHEPKTEAPVRKAPTRTPAELEAELARLTLPGNPVGDAAIADLRATILIAANDARAPEAALDAARKHLAVHKLQAASDVLLDLIGAGFEDREAHRLLIEVNCELGARGIAREKCALLGAVYRLDGQGAVAEDVERLANLL